ncbi:carbohydrate ABC transporter permease [Pseudogulbenkiania subflava]|uniref:Carbohydrate ABC transporter membrane protein 1, CUT1 family (TC 3.A.1.1.-) n=1 Tax=Pseudogulbenkiania subflava DSM 22618 TaxID=1123014 RepID=A0A1Y6CAD6_9NEIS|nr:sugar ABC transporter permease [Pseudogulbenkiania subflava]SMF51479.1 carbohydrate ABC transporter membrane protein 1, CUT1 family (TC 3.A.1.1.-) [Pseudogulbenkiania subflava DSM 22618]
MTSQTLTSAAPARPSTAESSLQRSRQRMAWLLVAPALVVLLAIAGLPLARTLWLSLTDAQLSDLSTRQFVGLANYIGDAGVLADPEWWGAVKNTLWFSLLSVSLETVLGLAVALMLNHPSRLKTLLRAAVLVPWAIPTVVSAKMWTWMLHDQFGVINAMLLALGLIHQPLAWTADPDLAFTTIVLVDVWKTTPFMALLILAALQMVPSDCYEAAKVDGVPKWSVFLNITLPLITPAVLVAMIFRTLDALRVFDLIYVMTSNSRTTKSMSVYVREQLIDFQLAGYGSAAATLLFLMIALITVSYMALARRRMEGH